MTPEQQKEFTDAIQNLIYKHKENQEDYEIWDDQYCSYEDRILTLKWVLAQFNQIKNIAESETELSTEKKN